MKRASGTRRRDVQHNQNIQLVLVEEDEKEFRGALGARFSDRF